jgi:hypothetical protein
VNKPSAWVPIKDLLSKYFHDVQSNRFRAHFYKFTNQKIRTLKKRLRRAKTKVERERVRNKMREYRASLVAQKLSEE